MLGPYYSEALVEHPLTVLPIFADYLDEAEAKLGREIWQLIATTRIEFMDVGAEQGPESRGIWPNGNHDQSAGLSPVGIGGIAKQASSA